MSEFLEIPVLVQPLTPLSVGGVSIPIGSFQTTITIRAEDLTLNLGAHAQIGVGVPELQQVRAPQFTAAPAPTPQQIPQQAPVPQIPQPAARNQVLEQEATLSRDGLPWGPAKLSATSAEKQPEQPTQAAPQSAPPTDDAPADPKGAPSTEDDDDFLPPPIAHEVGSEKNPLQLPGREESNADFLQRFRENV